MMSASSPTDTDSNTRLVVTTPTSVAESVTTPPPPQAAPTATKSRVKFLVEKANENELLLGPTKSGKLHD